MPNPVDKSKIETQLIEALASTDPLKDVMSLVLKLSREGVADLYLKELLTELLDRAQQDETQWQNEAVLGDVLDLIEGFFVPNPQNAELKRFTEHFRQGSVG